MLRRRTSLAVALLGHITLLHERLTVVQALSPAHALRYSGSSSKCRMPSRFASSSSTGFERPNYRNIDFDEMTAVIQEYEEKGREESGFVVIDVRTDEEVLQTGKLGKNVWTLPIQLIAQYNTFALDEEEFEEVCGFEKPKVDETLVFTCAAGVRSAYACQFAAQAGGYSKLINYTGGANEWFYKQR